jgi:death-on-curing family protein
MGNNEILIYQSSDNSNQIEVVIKQESIWLSQEQISILFGTKRPAISKHLKNIFLSNELNESEVCSILEHTTKHGAIKSKTQKVKTKLYNLDAILSVGYRVNSKQATQFRIWATQRLKEYLIKGYAINPKKLEENKEKFLQTLEDLKLLAQNNPNIETKDVLSLIQTFSNTFFALDSYDKNEFPKQGTKQEIKTSAKELKQALQQLKNELIQKGEATELFAQEKAKGNLEGIFGNVFQTVFGEDAYPTIEEKAAHLLYFIIKNHPFNDGNKRCGAFSFVWLLQKAGYHFKDKISPETLTTLTILIAESNPADKNKMIGIVKLVLSF